MGGKKKIPVSTGDRYGRLTVVSEVAKTYAEKHGK